MTYCVEMSRGPCHCQPDEGCYCRNNSGVAELQKQLREAEAKADACRLEATFWKSEFRTASATIAEIYQELTGKTGEPGDWNGAKPVKAAFLRKQAEVCALMAEKVKEAEGNATVESIYDGLVSYAEKYLKQADEAENKGGGES